MMRLDAALGVDAGDDLSVARTFERAGFGTAWTGETKHDPFMRSLRILSETSTMKVGTAIALAFARNPMTVANSGYDLAGYGEGRFVLGLGSQVKGHIERRFSMTWSQPAARMREFVLAVRAIWDAWETGTDLAFNGEFYTHTLMPDFFRPDVHSYGPPPIQLAAVGTLMTEVAGEVADGLLFHPFITRRYLEEFLVPALARGRQRSGRAGRAELRGVVMAAIGRDQAELEVATTGIRNEIAFYASTPSYRPVLDAHGWGAIGDQLVPMSRAQRWDEMAQYIDDEMVNTFAVVGSPAQVADQLQARFGETADSVWLSTPYEHGPALWPDVATHFTTHVAS